MGPYLGPITGRGPHRQDTPWCPFHWCCEKNGWSLRKMDALAKEVSFRPWGDFFVSPLSILVVKGCIYSYVNLEPSDLEVSQIHKRHVFYSVIQDIYSSPAAGPGDFLGIFDRTPVLVLVESLKHSGDSWVYPYQRTPMGHAYISYISPI